jgi:hypothetical protein
MSNTPTADSLPASRGGESGARERGLILTNQHSVSSIATVDVDGRPPADVWRDLTRSEDFQHALIESIRDGLDELTPVETYDVLDEAGVSALGGSYADLVRDVARGDSRALWTLLRATAEFGQPQDRRETIGVGLDAPLSAVATGPLAVLGLTNRGTGTETIAVRIGPAFREQRADQRRTVCSLLADLAQVFDVRLVASGLTHRFLASEHRADLPGVSDPCIDSPRAGRLAILVERAFREFDPDGRPVAILQSIAAEPSETLSYRALYAEPHGSDSRVRQCVGRLRDHDLVATFDGPNGTTVDLLPAGDRLLERLNEQIGRQRRLDEYVSDAGKSSDHGRVTPPAWEAPPTADRTDEAEALEAADIAAHNGQRDWSHGAVDVRYLSHREHASAVASAESNGIGLVDHPIESQEDGRQPGWSFDKAAGRLVVSAEYYNPMQWWVAVTRALASAKTWNHILALDRLDGGDEEGDLAGLDTSSLRLLRDGRCLGWLADRDADGEGVAERLQQARADLLDLTRALKQGNYADRDAFRGETLRFAQGLAGTMIHLLDLAGIDVVRELRLPKFRRDRRGDEDFRADLAETLAIGTAIQSRYGHFATYRQLFEDRPEKRESAIPPDVDAADPFGSLLGSFAIVGPGVSGLESNLRQAVRSPANIHEDAPEFALCVPIHDRTQARSAFAQAVRSICRVKGLAPTRTAIALCRALAGSPYDAAAALHGLAPESKAPGREIAADEVRYALSTLPLDRVMPEVPPTVSKIVHALLTAVEPLTQAELADRAGVSSRSVRNHRTVLEAFDLVRETESTLRFALPFRDERADQNRGAALLPFYAAGNPDRSNLTRTSDVLFAVVDRLIDDPSRLADPADPIGGPFFEAGEFDLDRLCRPAAWPWLRPWVSLAMALLDIEGDIEEDTDCARSLVIMGAGLDQQPIQQVSEADRPLRSSLKTPRASTVQY